MPLTIAEEVREAGRQVASATGTSLVGDLNGAIERFLGWPYRVASGHVVDRDNSRTEAFATTIYVAPGSPETTRLDAIPADRTAAVIDACENMDLDSLRAAYARIALSKRLKKLQGRT